jgi:tetratricopeptide (TPR) repeat protein
LAKWTEILNDPVGDTLSFTPVLQHFARGMAFANTNKITDAEKELAIMQNKMREPSLKEPLTPFNSVYAAALVAENILAGTIAENKMDMGNAVTLFNQAVKDEDKLIYNEPRDWLLPARQYLGAALTKTGNYQKAIEVFRKDLEINPNNGWSLSGLKTCYQQLKNGVAVTAVKKQLKIAWSIKDINIEDAVF